MKFTETTYGNHTNILAFPDHYIAVPVMVDSTDSAIVANGDGKKILSAGSPIGGGFLSSTTAKALSANAPGSVDLVSTGANNDITITNKTTKAMKIQLVDPAANSQALKVQVVNDKIEVLLATSGAGAITSTGAEVVALLNANAVTGALISAANKGTDTGAAAVTAVAATDIPAPTVVPEAILLHDVDVTNGDAPGAALIHGFVSTTALTSLSITPCAAAVSALKGIQFVN
ncbi:MAG: hypothetical protein AB9917_13680 [Negativicutes bacterium]